MATTPEIPVKVNIVPPVENVRVHNPAEGTKPGSFYKAAARSRGDRNYTPRYDIIEA